MVLSSTTSERIHNAANIICSQAGTSTQRAKWAFLVSPVFACESANAMRFDLTCSDLGNFYRVLSREAFRKPLLCLIDNA